MTKLSELKTGEQLMADDSATWQSRQNWRGPRWPISSRS